MGNRLQLQVLAGHAELAEAELLDGPVDVGPQLGHDRHHQIRLQLLPFDPGKKTVADNFASSQSKKRRKSEPVEIVTLNRK